MCAADQRLPFFLYMASIRCVTRKPPKILIDAMIKARTPKIFASQLPDTIPYEIAGNLKQAVNHAARDASLAAGQGTEAVVLLSPAAASFDQFPNFEKRGEAFKDAVAALEGFQPSGG